VAHGLAIFAHTGFYRPDDVHQSLFRELFAQIIEAGRQAGATLNCWRLTCWNSCCYDAWKRLMNRLIRRWITACVMPASTSATTLRTASLILPASRNTSVCPVPVVAPVPPAAGVSVLSWREDQRISQAKLLLSTTRMPIATVGRNVGLKINSISRASLKNVPGPARVNSAPDVNET
jgi:AraC family transcriptional regulator of arabinose operon